MYTIDPANVGATYIKVINSSNVQAILGGPGGQWTGRAASTIPLTGPCRIQFSCNLPFATIGLSDNPTYNSTNVLNY